MALTIKQYSTNFTSQAVESVTKLIAPHLDSIFPSSLFLSGGSSVSFYTQLFHSGLSDKSCNHLTLALADERFGKKGHANSNELALADSGAIDPLIENDATFLPMLSIAELPFDRMVAAANRNYRRLLATTHSKIALLGMGEDGHTLSWMPTRTQANFATLYQGSNHHVVIGVDLDETTSNNPHRKRLTLSQWAIGEMDVVIVIAAGKKKQSALQKVSKTKGIEAYQLPIAGLKVHPNVWIFTD